jgi:hypothetical protein
MLNLVRLFFALVALGFDGMDIAMGILALLVGIHDFQFPYD